MLRRRFAFVLFIVLLTAAQAFALQKNVLILNSYEQGFSWSDDINEGIGETFLDSIDINIHTEYLDIPIEQMFLNHTKNDAEVLNRILEKYKEMKFDVIVTIDYAAFNFVKKYREIFWKGIPIVSCAINEEYVELLSERDSLWAGIVEHYEVHGMINFIKYVQPNIKRIAFVTDRTRFGTFLKNFIASYNASDSITIEEWEKPAWESLPKFLKYLDPQRDAVVLAGINFNDSIKNSQKLWEITTEYVNTHSRAPVYTFWGSGIINGIVGGKSIVAKIMGVSTGKIVLSILNKKKSQYEFENSTSLMVVDDQAALARNLNPKNFPAETYHLNKMDSWSSRYQKYVSNMWNLILAELVIILILALAFYAYYKISHRKLVKEIVKTKEASKAKSTFLASMSHEIRNPLNSMLGFSELLLSKNKGLSDEQNEWIYNIRLSSYLLRDTLNNILDYSKMEVGKIELEEREIDIFALCDDLVSVCWHYILYKHEVRLYVMPSFDLPRFITVDPVRLQQVLANLVGNALKFTNKGAVRLMIKPLLMTGEYATILFEVIDTGIGMSNEGIKKIFTAFEQLDNGESSETKKYNGAGLGLAIANGILHNMNSELKVKSQVGLGSEFSFQLLVKAKIDASFLEKFLFMKTQKITIFSTNIHALRYIKSGFLAVDADYNDVNKIELVFSTNNRDLLIAEGDSFTEEQLYDISTIFSRIILFFYCDYSRVRAAQKKYPNFFCLSAPIKSGEVFSSVLKLYGR